MTDPYTDATRDLIAKLIGEVRLVTAQRDAITRERDAIRWERDELAARCMKQELDLLDAGGQLQDQDDEIAALRRELARWEDAADTLGPVGRPVDD